MNLKMTLMLASATVALLAGGGAAFAQDTTITIESWRTDDLSVWQDKIIPAFEAANPGIDPNHLKVKQVIHLPAAGSTGIIGIAGNTGNTGSSTIALGGSSATTRPSAGGTRSTSSSLTARSVKPGSSYTIRKGDSLQTIAQAAYGNKTAWKRIFRANRSELSDANTIPVVT